MTLLDLSWIPLVGMSLAISAGGFAGYALRSWTDPNEQMFTKVSCMAMAASVLYVILMSEQYLAVRYLAALVKLF